jgi:hypothetical protein
MSIQAKSREVNVGTKKKSRFSIVLVLTMVAIVVLAFFLQSYAKIAALLPATFEGATSDQQVLLRVANTFKERQRGLMYETNLLENEGMIFIFAEEEVHPFWMKNTPLSLDMIFLNSNKQVVGVLNNTPPFSEQNLSIEEPSLYVIELKAGMASKLGINKGTKVIFHGPLPLGVK